MPLAPGDQVGPYLLQCLIGVGGMGEVFQATDTRLRRPVALKFLRSDRAADLTQRNGLLQEARAVSSLNHPNIVVVHDIASHQGDDFLVMEYVSGTPLDILIERERPSVFRIAEIGAQIASALGAAHAAGVLHRDVKAQNILRDATGRIVLGDFGTGIPFDEDAGVSDPQIAGTPLYLAPEVIEGRPATVSSDLYSVGVLLYFLVTGDYPVRGRTLNEIREAHAAATRAPVRKTRGHFHSRGSFQHRDRPR